MFVDRFGFIVVAADPKWNINFTMYIIIDKCQNG